MRDFFILEGAYIILALIIMAVTLFVTTRDFMSKGSVKRGVIWVGGFLVVAILSHFWVTKSRMNKVIEAFNQNREIICENRVYTKGANFVTIKKSNEWSLKDNNFISPNYTRVFFTARCFVK